MRWFVYILQNERRKNYIGHSEDLNARLKEHNQGSEKKLQKHCDRGMLNGFAVFEEKRMRLRLKNI